jgi:hypothetical protein
VRDSIFVIATVRHGVAQIMLPDLNPGLARVGPP